MALDQAAFDDWVAYRNASKYGPLTETGIQRLIKRLERLGELQRAAVDHSIRCHHQGVWAPRGLVMAVNSEDSTRLAEVMRRWGTVHRNVVVTSGLISAYRSALQNMTPEEFERAVQHLDKHSTWYPKPSEIWQAARTVGWM